MTTRLNEPNHQFLRRPCEKCDNMFKPVSKFNFVCGKCYDKIEWGRWKKKSIKIQLPSSKIANGRKLKKS